MIELTKSEIRYAIDHYKELAKKEHYTDAMAKKDRERGFDYEFTLEVEGFYIVPDSKNKVDFDFGDTHSGGELLDGVSPMEDVDTFAENLLDSLKDLLKRKDQELKTHIQNQVDTKLDNLTIKK